MEYKKQREKNRALHSNSTPPSHSTEEQGKQTTELHEKYKKLEQDWNAFKESRSTTSRKYRSPITTITKHIFEQLDISNNFVSPKELMSSLQRDSLSEEEEEEDEEPWKDYGVVLKEILQERREDVERGRIKGRRLFESMSESESDHDNDDNNVVSQSEVRSMSFSYSGDEDEDEDEDENELLGSSLSPPIGDFVDKDMVANVEDIRVGSYKSRFINGTRYGGFLGGFVVFVFLIVAICIRLRISYGGHDFDVILVPT